MKVKAVVEKTKINENGMFALLKFNGKLPKEKTIVTVSFGKVRSNKQNSIYWCLLGWYLENTDIGHQYIDTTELHEQLKGRLLSKRVMTKGGFETRVIGSTTELTADDFMSYIEKCEHIIQEYCGVSAAPFWTEYHQTYGGE